MKEEICSFCGISKPKTILLVAGINGNICDVCIDQAVELKKMEEHSMEQEHSYDNDLKTVYLKREDQPKEHLNLYNLYGYGWAIYSEGQIILHSGLIGGFRSNVLFIPSLNIFSVLLSNFRYPLEDQTIENLSNDMALEAINSLLLKKTISNNLKKELRKIKSMTIPIGFE